MGSEVIASYSFEANNKKTYLNKTVLSIIFYRNDVSADEKGELLGDKVREID